MLALESIEDAARDWEFLELDPREVIARMSSLATGALAGQYDEILKRQAEAWQMRNRPGGRPRKDGTQPRERDIMAILGKHCQLCGKIRLRDTRT